MKRRYLCALTITIITIIIGLHHFGVALFEYNGEKNGTFLIEIKNDAKETNYYKVYNGTIDNKMFLIYVPKKFENLSIGDKIEAEAEFSEPTKARNNGGFDYSLYLKSKKIYGTFKIEEIKNISKAKSVPLINRIQNNIKENLKRNLKKENVNLAIRVTLRRSNQYFRKHSRRF